MRGTTRQSTSLNSPVGYSIIASRITPTASHVMYWFCFSSDWTRVKISAGEGGCAICAAGEDALLSLSLGCLRRVGAGAITEAGPADRVLAVVRDWPVWRVVGSGMSASSGLTRIVLRLAMRPFSWSDGIRNILARKVMPFARFPVESPRSRDAGSLSLHCTGDHKV
jgi:hypothetical protein